MSIPSEIVDHDYQMTSEIDICRYASHLPQGEGGERQRERVGERQRGGGDGEREGGGRETEREGGRETTLSNTNQTDAIHIKIKGQSQDTDRHPFIPIWQRAHTTVITHDKHSGSSTCTTCIVTWNDSPPAICLISG